jgi:ferredoxin
MLALQEKARELLGSGKAGVVIGYGNGSGDRVRPVFIRKSADASKLIMDSRCRQNLAVYLLKPEVKRLGKPAIVALPSVVKTIVQLISENQLTSADVVTIVAENDEVVELSDDASLEAYSASHPVIFPPFARKEIETIAGMSLQKRFEYWQNELSRCVKCYACRAACPLCYCERCVTDDNRPQWVCVPSHAQGNFEWHMNRAMHLAGRCIECGSCTIACPVGIPIGLLTIEATRIVEHEFGYRPGLRCDAPSALSSFKVEDKEEFIV